MPEKTHDTKIRNQIIIISAFIGFATTAVAVGIFFNSIDNTAQKSLDLVRELGERQDNTNQRLDKMLESLTSIDKTLALTEQRVDGQMDSLKERVRVLEAEILKLREGQPK